MIRDRENDFQDIRSKWRCSQCGRLNSMDHDNICPKCFEAALEEDRNKLDAVSSQDRK